MEEGKEGWITEDVVHHWKKMYSIDCIEACVLSLCARLHHHVGYLTMFTGSAEVLLMLMENASSCSLFQDLQEMR